VRSILVALSGVVAPGFAHGLMEQRRAMAIAIASVWVAASLVVVTIWALWLVMAVWLAVLIDAGLRHRRLTKGGRRLRYHWLWALAAFGIAVVVGGGFRLFVAEAFRIPSSSMYPTLQIGDHLMIQKVFQSTDRGDLIVFRQPCEPQRDYISRVIAVGGDTIEIRCSVVFLNGHPLERTLVDAHCTYDDFYERFSMDGHSGGGEWTTKSCSRYREVVGSRAHELFHSAEQPTMDANRDTADAKDFPMDRMPRSCSFQPEGEPRAATNQQPGKVVVTRSDGTEPCKPYMHYVVPEDHVFVLGDNRPNSNDSRYWGSVPLENIKGNVQGLWFPLSRFGAVR
jgi:signal peptidase I